LSRKFHFSVIFSEKYFHCNRQSKPNPYLHPQHGTDLGGGKGFDARASRLRPVALNVWM